MVTVTCKSLKLTWRASSLSCGTLQLLESQLSCCWEKFDRHAAEMICAAVSAVHNIFQNRSTASQRTDTGAQDETPEERAVADQSVQEHTHDNNKQQETVSSVCSRASEYLSAGWHRLTLTMQTELMNWCYTDSQVTDSLFNGLIKVVVWQDESTTWCTFNCFWSPDVRGRNSAFVLTRIRVTMVTKWFACKSLIQIIYCKLFPEYTVHYTDRRWIYQNLGFGHVKITYSVWLICCSSHTHANIFYRFLQLHNRFYFCVKVHRTRTEVLFSPGWSALLLSLGQSGELRGTGTWEALKDSEIHLSHIGRWKEATGLTCVKSVCSSVHSIDRPQSTGKHRIQTVR